MMLYLEKLTLLGLNFKKPNFKVSHISLNSRVSYWNYCLRSLTELTLELQLYSGQIFKDVISMVLNLKVSLLVKPEEIETMFDPASAIDLYYDVVKKFTEWPTRDHSIKTLAKYLGFDWRDPSPSGAESIEWYHRWVETGDSTIQQRILAYNEDDCLATRVVLDGIRNLNVSL